MSSRVMSMGPITSSVGARDGPRVHGKSRDANFVPRRMPFVKLLCLVNLHVSPTRSTAHCREYRQFERELLLPIPYNGTVYIQPIAAETPVIRQDPAAASLSHDIPSAPRAHAVSHR